MTAEEIMLALIRKRFNLMSYLVVPNVWYGFSLNHECDLLAISKSGYATEIEIKISVADVKKDLDKKHNHKDEKIKYLWFAMPDKIYEKSLQYIPERAGILTLSKRDDTYFGDGYIQVFEKRTAIAEKYTNKITDVELKNLQRLMAMRYWSLLKKHVRMKGE